MRNFFDFGLFVVSLIFVIGFALLVMGLGYLGMTVVLLFGWGALFAFIGIITVVGFLEGAMMTIIMSPVLLAKTAFVRRKHSEAPTKTDGEAKSANTIKYTFLVLIATGAIVANLQFLFQKMVA